MASKPEPTDMHAYYDHLPTFEAVEEANARTVFNQRVMLGLTAVQVFCACGFLGLEDTTPNTTGQTLLLVASATVLLSGVLGFFGTWKLYKGLLNWFFISQLWCLSVVITLLLRGQLTDANETILCSQSSVGYAGCSAISGGWIVFFSAIAGVIVYISVFFADSLSEALQDETEKKDTLQITKFVWLMNKKTTVGIHRFEDLIHKEFQELVEMGYLKLKPNAPKSPSS